ncbi:MAG: hypothetical protein LBV14_14190 [Acidovorax sp.]|nr:hypothetical protein [Acidovorax sp.]
MVEILVSQAMHTPSTASAYKARDVVNAPAIKERIQARSAERGDAPDVAAWLANHFCRHVIGNVQAEPPAVQPIADTQTLQQLQGRKPAPEWALARLAKQAAGFDLPALWWVDADAPEVLALETRLVEFLSTRKGTSLEGKLQRVNAPQALARWTLEHLAFEKKQNSGRVEHSPSAVHGLLRGQHGTFVEFDGASTTLRQEMAYESQMMGHCVGQFADRQRFSGGYGEHYAEACEKGRMRLFSYRTGSAQPRITVNAYLKEGGLLQIEQIKGKQNRPPIVRYAADVVALLNHLPLNDVVPHDALAMGIVRRPAHLLAADAARTPWCAAADMHSEAEQLWLLQQHPDLLDLGMLRSPLVQWMALARKDSVGAEGLERMPKTPAQQHALEQAKRRGITRAGVAL